MNNAINTFHLPKRRYSIFFQTFEPLCISLVSLAIIARQRVWRKANECEEKHNEKQRNNQRAEPQINRRPGGGPRKPEKNLSTDIK